MTPAAEELTKQGLLTQTWVRERATIDAWRLLLMGGFGCDALFVNSHGVHTQFGMNGGTTANAGDVPLFDHPVMVHFLHSFSLEVPNLEDSVGGRFIANGAYAYFGSVYEPMLPAFVPPALIAARCGALVPFLLAARTMEGAFARPWRTAGYGDPLTLLATANKIGIKRIDPPIDDAPTLRANAAADLTKFRDTKDASALVSAMRELELCGDDAGVLLAWELVSSTDQAAVAAPYALGALFRARDIVRYPIAFAKCAVVMSGAGKGTNRDRVAREMLWQLFLPRLGAIEDKRVVALLGKFPRGWDVTIDLTVIKPTIKRVLGNPGWNAICDYAVSAAADKGSKDRIELLR